MAKALEYFLDVDGSIYPVTEVSIKATTFGLPDGDVGSVVSFETPDETSFGSDVSAFNITEVINGVEVGSIHTSDVLQSYSFDLSHPPSTDPLFADEAIVENLTITGEFDQSQPCFVAGTSIASARGPKKVEDLVAGDTVLLATGGTANVTWVGHRRQFNATVVRVGKDAFGAGVPIKDLFVSEDHAFFLEDVLVPARSLVNGKKVVREIREVVMFFHVELDQHGILLAEDAPAESYLDTGNRRQFSNAPLRQEPSRIDLADFAQQPFADIVWSGQRVATILASLSSSEAT